ncbi:MAG TPA: hypothetical protein VFM18_21745 [Methanosarcina sp.]|nr:hypothetical protein [Methanosarcina sp.]
MQYEVNLTNLLLGVVGFLIVYVLNGIKKEITEVKTSVSSLVTSHSELEVRVARIETIQKMGTTCGFKITD